MAKELHRLGILVAMVGGLGSAVGPTLASGADEALLVSKAPKGGATQESFERDVDRVALESQEASIQKLKGLLKKYVGKRQEPSLLSKLAELQTQKAAIRFRLAHGSASQSGARKSAGIAAYKADMAAAISTLNTLIGKYPGFEEIALAYFLRGRSHEEMESRALAAKDYTHLVKNFPDSEHCTSAYMSLAQFAIDENQHAKAIGYLEEVEKKPDDPKYPFALYKLAWSHYNLKSIPRALAYAEKHVAYYNARRSVAAKGQLDPSDESFRENMLLDATVFFFEGFEQKDERYAITEALPAFRKLESGAPLGRMLSRYTKLLRSHGHEQPLLRWKDIVMKEEAKRPEALEVLVTVFDFQVGKRRYTQVQDTTADFLALYRISPKLEGWPKAQKLILDTAEELQRIIVKNKAADGVGALSTVLASIYDSFTRIVDESDPRIPRVHYNLAETLFEIKDFEQATTHYRWVVSHGEWSSKDKGPASVADASLKAIGARYEALRGRSLIPGTIAAKPIASTQLKTLDPALAEWIAWVDEHVRRTKDPIESFAFEAARALYDQGHVLPAVQRLEVFAEGNAKSKFAQPAASLVLDSYLASEDWAKVHALANQFLGVKEWKGQEFEKRLFAIAADASYKILETQFRKKEYASVLSAADGWLKRYAASERFADTLFMAGSAALASQNQDLATRYYTRLITEAPKADSVRAALLNRAAISEDRYAFADAARDYQAYLQLPPLTKEDGRKGDETIREKALTFAWLTGDIGLLRETIANAAVCVSANATLCNRYSALLAINARAFNDQSTQAAYDNARQLAPEPNRGYWALAALANPKALSFHHRMNLIRQVAAAWDEFDPLIRYSLIPVVSQSIPNAFLSLRAELPTQAPLRANPKWIARRVEVMKEVETTATKAMKLPWSRVRAQVLAEMGGVYLDLAKGIQSLPAPKDLAAEDLTAYEDTVRKLVVPFEEKGNDMRAKAFEIASRFAIEDESFAAIAEPYFIDNPSLTKRLKPATEPSRPQSLDTTFLAKLDPEGDWDDLELDSKQPASRLKAHWADALMKKSWARVGYFLFHAQAKGYVTGAPLALARAVSFAAAGARGEALAELADARKELVNPDARKHATLVLLNHYFSSLSRERTKEMLTDYFRLDPDSDVAVRGPKDAPVATLSPDGKPASPPAVAAPADRRPASTHRNPLLRLISSAAEWAGV